MKLENMFKFLSIVISIWPVFMVHTEGSIKTSFIWTMPYDNSIITFPKATTVNKAVQDMWDEINLYKGQKLVLKLRKDSHDNWAWAQTKSR